MVYYNLGKVPADVLQQWVNQGGVVYFTVGDKIYKGTPNATAGE